uniref:Uncharacterized protein n=1 Tax=Eucampia antarctica TaxID=49252 RepID=A0A6U0R8M6_9STRA|mmetsp:Transcript_20071/g.19320  ORF Transcript_20071/g.19320 Transcript_20071/m.19320 type:complete len:110 (+) Transcript_20071:51-380(+)
MAPSREVMNSSELNALATVFPICCNDSYKKYIEGKRQKLNLTQLTKVRDELEACVLQTFTGVNEKCDEISRDVLECLSSNQKSWEKCSHLRAQLEVCVVKNKLGELSKV